MAANSGCHNEGEHASLKQDMPSIGAADARFEASAPTKTTAVQTVFNTYELLEQILLLLPLHKLHSIQRVARSWQALIERSHRLSQAMFLMPSSQPITPNSSISDHVSYNTHFKLNPVVLAETDCPEHERHFAFRSLQAMAQSLIAQRHTHDEVQISITSGWLELLGCRGHDSRRWMYITQPPITQLELVVYRRATEGVRNTYRFTARRHLRWGNIIAGGREKLQEIVRDPELLMLNRIYLKVPANVHCAIRECDGQHGIDGLCKCLRFFVAT